MKVRIADVLPIEGSGLPEPFFEFALQAHYDFVVMGPDQGPLFAVEFDGPQHDHRMQAERDAKKDGLSHRFHLPLIRIQSEDLHRTDGKRDRLTELVEQWFANHTDAPSGGSTMETKPVCPICGDGMIEKPSKYGRFLSCVRFPDCRGSLDLPGAPSTTRLVASRNILIAGSIGAVILVVLLVVVAGFPGGPPQHPAGQRPVSREGEPSAVVTRSSLTLSEKLAYTDALDESEYPACPVCGSNMVVRRNSTTGEPFFGCSDFPRCRRTSEIDYPK